MRGTRNKKDGLQDIPIKSSIQHNNFKIPPIVDLYEEYSKKNKISQKPKSIPISQLT